MRKKVVKSSIVLIETLWNVKQLTADTLKKNYGY